MGEGGVMSIFQMNTYDILSKPLPEFIQEDRDVQRLAAFEHALVKFESWGACYIKDPNQTQQFNIFRDGFLYALKLFKAELNDKH
jgi:hypothetical protein